METKSLTMAETPQRQKLYYVAPQCCIIKTEYEGFICTTVTPNSAYSTEPDPNNEFADWDSEYLINNGFWTETEL